MGQWPPLGNWRKDLFLLRDSLQWRHHWCPGWHLNICKHIDRATYIISISLGLFKRTLPTRRSWLHNMQKGTTLKLLSYYWILTFLNSPFVLFRFWKETLLLGKDKKVGKPWERLKNSQWGDFEIIDSKGGTNHFSCLYLDSEHCLWRKDDICSGGGVGERMLMPARLSWPDGADLCRRWGVRRLDGAELCCREGGRGLLQTTTDWSIESESAFGSDLRFRWSWQWHLMRMLAKRSL